MDKYIRILDNSFISKYLYIYSHDRECLKSKDLQERCKKLWDQVLEAILIKVPNIEGDEVTIARTPFLCLEFMGLGDYKEKLYEQLKEELEKCFLPLYAMQGKLLRAKTDNERFAILEHNLGVIFNSLVSLYSEHINVCIIQKKYNEKLDKVWVHPYMEAYLKETISSWVNELIEKEGYAFLELAWQLAWKTLVRKISLYVNEEFLGKEREWVLKRMIGWYRDLKQNIPNYQNLSGVATLIALSSKDILFKEHKELVDAELIEYACTGYFYNGERKPVIIFSADKKDAIRRLEHCLLGIDYCNQYLSEDKKLQLMPGYIILVPRNPKKNIDANDIDVISIQEIIDRQGYKSILSNQKESLKSLG